MFLCCAASRRFFDERVRDDWFGVGDLHLYPGKCRDYLFVVDGSEGPDQRQGTAQRTGSSGRSAGDVQNCALIHSSISALDFLSSGAPWTPKSRMVAP